MSDIRSKLPVVKWAVKFHARFQKPCKKPAVALIVNSMGKGGVEQVVMDLYHGYKARGYRAYIVCANWQIDAIKHTLDAVEDVFVYNDDFSALAQFLWQKDIRTLHYHFNVFCIHIFHAMGFRTLYTMHNLYTFMNDAEISTRAKKLESADWFVPVASFVENYFVTRTQYHKANHAVINNGVNFDELDCQEGTMPITREGLGFEKNDLVIGFVASFYHVKHQIGMLGVMEKLVAKYPHAKLIFLGGEGDAEYHRYFDAALEQCSVKEAIRVIPFFDHKFIGRFYREVIDIFTLPTIHEGNPLTALEAMYCEKPMVITPTGLAQELESTAACLVAEPAYEDVLKLSSDEITKKLCLQKHARNEASLLACFCTMIDQLPAYQEKARQCKQNALLYSSEHMVDEYIKLF
ncbi:MAG: glycosyltransferase family 4 protein [Clostridia bacterium]